MAFKTVCPVTRDEFKETAKTMEISLDKAKVKAEPRQFSTNSLGWGFNDKVTLKIGGKEVRCQVGINITIIGSKELPLPKPPVS